MADEQAAAARPVIALQDAGKTFPNGTRALAPMRLAVQRCEFVTLLGPSGCGKSTLLKLIAGLLTPSEGSVQTACHKLGFVFQDATLMPWASVRANVRLPLDLEGCPRQEADGKVDAALAAVGLNGSASHRPREMSGGMRMRASIARALVNGPDLLLMDEPFGALDEISRSRLDVELVGLWADRRLSVVFVTHSIQEAVFLSTRVIVMSSRPGRIAHELRIEGPHRRDDAFRLGAPFGDYCRQLQQMLLESSAA